jgi:hypothetical protein
VRAVATTSFGSHADYSWISVLWKNNDVVINVSWLLHFKAAVQLNVESNQNYFGKSLQLEFYGALQFQIIYCNKTLFIKT